MLLKTYNKQLLIFSIAVFTSLLSFGQKNEYNYKTSFSTLLFLDYGYTKPGFAYEISASKKIFEKFYVRFWFHKSNSNSYPIPKDKFEGYVNYTNDDIYGNYFIGKSSAGFLTGKYDTYNRNSYLFNLALNRVFGKRKLKFIPEFGVSYGKQKEFKISLKEIDEVNNIIVRAKSMAYFSRNNVFGPNISFALEYPLQSNLNIQFNTKIYLTRQKLVYYPNNGIRNEGDPYEGIGIGFTLIKSFNKISFK